MQSITMIAVPSNAAPVIARLVALIDRPAAEPAAVTLQSKPNLPHYPAPADFQEERIIGHIAGAPVTGLAAWRDETGKLWRYDVRVELAGLTIETDGETLTIDAIDGERWTVAGIGTLIELAQAGYLAELITIARRWCQE